QPSGGADGGPSARVRRFRRTDPQGPIRCREVSIWDAGTFEVEKWEDGREIIAVLHGREDGGLGGVRRFALFNTGENGPNKDPEKNWMIHLIAGQDSKSDQRPAKTRPKAASRQNGGIRPSDIQPMLARIGDLDSVRR